MSVTALERDWLARPAPRPDAGLRLFCVPHAGGGTAAYAALARILPEWIELAVVRLPGRETRLREEPYGDIASLVGDLAVALRGQLDRPYAVFGHSLGALIGFELLHRLREAGAPDPVRLFASGRRAPQLPEVDPPISHLADDGFIAELQRRYDAIPAAVLAEPDLLAMLLPTLRADYRLVERYAYEARPELPCSLTVFGGASDPRVTAGELRAWHVHAPSSFRLRILPGGHFYLQGEEARVAGELVEDLPAHLHPAAGGP